MKKLLEIDQEGFCLLCDYPLVLGCHHHHVIAKDDKGPDHPLNVVGLCPNHHTVVECVRRHLEPKDSHRGKEWQRRAEAASKFIKALPEDRLSLFHALTKEHPLKKVIRDGVKPERQRHLAADIVLKDVQLLLEVNRARPHIVLYYRIERGDVLSPKNECECVAAIADVKKTLRPGDFREVVEMHLSAIGLPFVDPSWLQENNIRGLGDIISTL